MSVLPQSVQKVIEYFEKLPGVGPKSASRMVYYFLRNPHKEATSLADSLTEMDQKVKQCQHCYNIAESEICNICNSPLRDKKKLCIVEEPLDVVAFENSAVYDGVYFVLGGVISPADGIGADDLRFDQLKVRVRNLLKEIAEKNSKDLQSKNEDSTVVNVLEDGDIVEKNNSEKTMGVDEIGALEIIIATNPSLEGEATASYIKEIFSEEVNGGLIRISQLAMGLPTGADLEYADRLTLKRALDGRN